MLQARTPACKMHLHSELKSVPWIKVGLASVAAGMTGAALLMSPPALAMDSNPYEDSKKTIMLGVTQQGQVLVSSAGVQGPGPVAGRRGCAGRGTWSTAIVRSGSTGTPCVCTQCSHAIQDHSRVPGQREPELRVHGIH